MRSPGYLMDLPLPNLPLLMEASRIDRALVRLPLPLQTPHRMSAASINSAGLIRARYRAN